VSFVDPHHPFNAPMEFNRRYKPADMPVPQQFDRERCFASPLPAGVEDVVRRRATYPPELFQWALANYYAMIAHIDWCLGRLFDELEKLGLLEDTIIVFMSDHGEYAGDHGLLYKGSLLFDGLMRIPLIVSWGDRLVRAHRVKAMVEEVDVFPTVMSLAGLPVHAGVQGRDLSGMLTVGPEQDCPGVLCELDELVDKQYAAVTALRTDRWKLAYYPNVGSGMLFNLADDPGEYTNLYDDAGYASTRHELMCALLDRLHNTKDPLPIRLSQA
jgi:arylsulfatase A-like enzyme